MTLRSDVIYPVAARIEVRSATRVLVTSTIPREGVRGLEVDSRGEIGRRHGEVDGGHGVDGRFGHGGRDYTMLPRRTDPDGIPVEFIQYRDA